MEESIIGSPLDETLFLLDKNAFVVCNILRHVDIKLEENKPKELSEWTNYHEISHKTASLLMHSAFGPKAKRIVKDSTLLRISNPYRTTELPN